MGIILDLLVIAVIIIVAVIAAKKGFVRTLIEVVGFIAACVIVFTVSTPVAEFTYDKLIEPPMLSAVEKAAEEQAENAVGTVVLAIPGIFSKGAEKLGLTAEKLSVDASNGAVAAAQNVSQNVARPALTKIISVLLSVILMIILLFVVHFLARVLNKLFSFSVVGKLNRTLGGVIGAVKGVIIAFVICAVISTVMLFTTNGFLIFTPEAVEASYIFKALASLNPLALLIS